MGADESLPQQVSLENDNYVMISDNHQSNQLMQVPTHKYRVRRNTTASKNSQKVIKPAYTAVWSEIYSDSVPPLTRNGHFSVSSSQSGEMFIGFGKGQNGKYMNDIWRFDMITKSWTKFLTLENTERKGASATLSKNKLFIFGGKDNGKKFTNEVIAIDLQTKKVFRTTWDQVRPRKRAIFQCYDEKLYIYGGFNGKILNDLIVYDLNERRFVDYIENVEGSAGSASCPWVLIGHHIYSYGGTNTSKLFKLNLLKKKIKYVICSGATPPCHPTKSGLVSADNGKFLIYFGGDNPESHWSLTYACDLTKKWWFVMHVIPDYESTFLEAGKISDFGLFMIPRKIDFSFCYSERERNLYMVLGKPYELHEKIVQLSIGSALGVIHLRDDMLHHLHYTQFDHHHNNQSQ